MIDLLLWIILTVFYHALHPGCLSVLAQQLSHGWRWWNWTSPFFKSVPFGSISRLAMWPAILEIHKMSGVNFVSHTSQNIQSSNKSPQNCLKSPRTSEQSRICEMQQSHESDLTKHKESNICVSLTSTTGDPDLWWHERDQYNINQMVLMLWLTGLYIYFIHLRAVDWNAKPIASIGPTL